MQDQKKSEGESRTDQLSDLWDSHSDPLIEQIFF